MKKFVAISTLVISLSVSSYAMSENSTKVTRKIKAEYFQSLDKKNYKKAMALINKNLINVNMKDKFGWTALFFAADTNNINLAKFLVRKGADINVKDNEGFTPLHEAVVKNSYEVAKFLIEKGANVNAKDNYGYTPLHIASLYGNPKMVLLLIKHKADINAKDKSFC
jgi:ankyrin repeat protein